MKLIINKNQSKGMMGGVSFEVSAKLELSDEERKLIEHYKLENYILFERKMVNIWGKATDDLVSVFVKDLLKGPYYKCKNLDEVRGYSESLKTASETLKSYLEVARNFGGEEVLEY